MDLTDDGGLCIRRLRAVSIGYQVTAPVLRFFVFLFSAHDLAVCDVSIRHVHRVDGAGRADLSRDHLYDDVSGLSREHT